MTIQGLIPLGFQQITSLSSAATLTVPAGAEVAILSVLTQSVRFRDDGTAPDATHGVIIPAGVAPYRYEGDLRAVQFIQTAASASMDIAYYGRA